MFAIWLLFFLRSFRSIKIDIDYMKYTEDSNQLGYNAEWIQFQQLYGKKYDKNEENKRLEIFKMNSAKIMIHNKLFEEGKVSYKMAINQFTDMTEEERMVKYTGLINKQTKNNNYFVPNYEIDLPTNFDWRTKNVVTHVKNQGNCGSCYAFSAIGSLESQYALHNKKMIYLSEQNIVDCSYDYGNLGCSGGLMELVFNYVIGNKGVDTEKMYPYLGYEGKCKYIKNPFKLSSYKKLKSGNETDLLYTLFSFGPISIGIDVVSDFFSYSSGVYSSDTCVNTLINHGVLAVGYGVENGIDYWLVKNSWGADWGMHGYIKMSRNKNNQCGVASSAILPIL